MSLKCTNQDTVTSWLVESEARPGEHHMVELLHWDGFGECACEHFQMRILTGLKMNMPEKPCKHINAAKMAFADLVLKRMTQNALDQSTVTTDLT